MAQKLQLTRSEEYVHNFITENKLKKRVIFIFGQSSLVIMYSGTKK